MSTYAPAPAPCPVTGKRWYRGTREAAADLARFRGRSGRQPVRIYWCDHCWGWHLTAEPQRAARTP